MSEAMPDKKTSTTSTTKKPTKGAKARPKARASAVTSPTASTAVRSPAVPAPVATMVGKSWPASRPPRARPSVPPSAAASSATVYEAVPASIPPAAVSVRPIDLGAPSIDLGASATDLVVTDDPLSITSELEQSQPWSALTGSATPVLVPPTIDDERVPPDQATATEVPSESADPAAAPRDVEGEIREIEARLDELLRQSGRHRDDGHAPTANRRVGARPMVPSDREIDDDGLFGTAGRLLSTDYYLRQWGRLGMRTRAEEVDEFGLDRVYEARVMPLLEFVYRRYFRVEATGVANIPSEGACLLVSNHSGTVPLDGPMIRLAVQREHPARREVRWLAEDIVYHFPFAGAFATRIGAVRACQENAERLLSSDRLVAVFPEGIKGISKLFQQRYRLQRFGRGGYVKLALRTRAPLIPVAVVGGEETNPMLYKMQYLARGLGLPYIPVTPTFPWLGPLGLVPAPTKWRILFGEPIALDDLGPDAADDPIVVNRVNERVRTVIQDMLDGALAARRSVFF